MAKNALSPEELKTLIATMYGNTTVAGDYSVAYNQLTKVINKIGLQISIQGEYIDKLPELDGPELPRGKIIEEFFKELPNVLAYDRTGSTDGAPADPHFLKAYYSYPLERNTIKTSRRYEDYEISAIDERGLFALAGDELAEITKTTDVYLYGLKREMIGYAIGLVEKAQNGLAAGGVTTYSAAAAANLELGTLVAKSNSATADHGIVLVDKGQITNGTTFDQAVAAGQIAKFDLVTKIAKPTNTATGEAFIKQVINDLEVASENGTGHSLNGAFIGATSDLMLVTLPGVSSVLSVDVKAGAFHREELAVGAVMRSIKDFGSYSGKAWAVLFDRRMFALYTDYLRDRVRENADGDFVNFVRHIHKTPFISTATFIKVYVEPDAA